MAIQTLKPNGDFQRLPNWIINGGTTAYAVMSDGSDVTYIRADQNQCDATKALILDLEDWVLPAGARIRQVRSRFRGRDRGSYYGYETSQIGYLRLNNVESGRAWNGTGSTSFGEYASGWELQSPGGGEWTQSSLDALQISLYSCGQWFLSAGSDFAEASIDVDYNYLPTVTATQPPEAINYTDRNRITGGWTYSDPEGDTQSHYQAKIFTSAQYTATGFDPETSAAFWDSGLVASSVTPGTIDVPVDLPNGTYRFYVKARQAWPLPTPMDSPWDYQQFGINITPPVTPTVTAAPDLGYANGARTLITVTGTAAAGEMYEVQWSDFSGVWSTLRGAKALIPSGNSASVFDYEAPPQTTRFYRARTYKTSGLAISSPWSPGLVGASWTSKTWRLHHPSQPGLNISLLRDDSNVELASEEPAAVNYAIGRRNPIVVKGQIQGENITLKLLFETHTDYLAFEALRNTQDVLFLISDMNRAWYVSLIGSRTTAIDRTTGGATPWWHTVQVSAVEQDPPT